MSDETKKHLAALYERIEALESNQATRPLDPKRDQFLLKRISSTTGIMTTEINGREYDLHYGTGGGSPSNTIVIGPASNSDSTDYDYTTDGTADNVELQQALDYINANGGTLVMREGTYTIAAPITFYGTTFGYGATIQAKSSYYNGSTITTMCEVYNSKVFGLSFHGNSDNQSSNGSIVHVESDCQFVDCSLSNAAGHVVDLDGAYAAMFSRCTFNSWVDGYNCIHTTTACGLKAEHCTFIGSYGYHIYTLSGSTYLPNAIHGCTFTAEDNYDETLILLVNGVISGCQISIGDSAGSAAVVISGSTNTRILGNYITFGATANVASKAISGGIATNNFVYNAGIGVYSPYICVGNLISGTRGHGILVGTSDTANICANYISECGQAANDTYSGINLDDQSYIVVDGNVIIATAGNKVKYGVREETGADRNIITSNAIVGPVTSDVSTVGANTKTDNNT